MGGKNKVVMCECRQALRALGLKDVKSYINSGNIFFESTKERSRLVRLLEDFLRDHYPFIQAFSLFNAEAYRRDYQRLPSWWFEGLARKDVLFFTERMDRATTVATIRTFELADEILHIGELGIYWGKVSEHTFAQTTYHKKLLKTPFYRQLTIRNAKTFEKIGHLLTIEKD